MKKQVKPCNIIIKKTYATFYHMTWSLINGGIPFNDLLRIITLTKAKIVLATLARRQPVSYPFTNMPCVN